MRTERKNIHRTHHVAGTGGPTMRAAVYPAVLAPLPAYGARLRGIGFAEGNGPSRLVIKLLDEFTGTGTTDLLGLPAPDALGRIVEGFT